ncbi:MAG: tetratricopeptide repeat protein [Ruminococcus sp.]|nr:tetratricopeptide repeat protein [Ruminococcus sp.]
MQKKSKIIIISIAAALVLVVGVFTAISLIGSSEAPVVQAGTSEQLSLGQKFLIDLEYEKAVAEFNAVIEIEPKNVDAYIGLADAYIGMGDEEKAIETLEKGLAETGDERLTAKLDEMKKAEETTVETTTVPETTTTAETTPETTAETTTAPQGARTERVDNDDGSYWIEEYDSNGNYIKSSFYRADGTLEHIDEFVPDRPGWIKYSFYSADGMLEEIGEYDSDGKLIKWSRYSADGTLEQYDISEYDSDGKLIKWSQYSADGTLDYYNIFEYGVKELQYSYNSDGMITEVAVNERYESGALKKQTRYTYYDDVDYNGIIPEYCDITWVKEYNDGECLESFL